jgi:hypothetical protein
MDITDATVVTHFSTENHDDHDTKNSDSDSVSNTNRNDQWYVSYDSKDVLWGKPTDLPTTHRTHVPSLVVISDKKEDTATSYSTGTSSKVIKEAIAMDPI